MASHPWEVVLPYTLRVKYAPATPLATDLFIEKIYLHIDVNSV